MSLLSNVLKVDDVQPGIRMIVAGAPGIGKTQFATSAEQSLLVACEDGHIGVDRCKVDIVPISDYISLVTLFSEISELITAGTNKYKTIIVDSTSAVEKFIHHYILSTDSTNKLGKMTMNDAAGGWGKAYLVANNHWNDVLNWGLYFSNNGINFVMTSHTTTSVERDTIAGIEYSFSELSLHAPKNNKTIGSLDMCVQWADIIGMLYTEKSAYGMSSSMMVADVEKSGTVKMSVSPSGRARSKNRFNLLDPIDIPRENGWNALADAIFESCGKDYRSK